MISAFRVVEYDAPRGWPLTGRVDELRALTESTVATSRRPGQDTDRPQGVLISGPPGVGKTRLARETAALANRLGWRVAWVAGTASNREIPMSAFAEWAGEPDADPMTLVNRVADRLGEGTESPLLLVIDDAHLLDEQSGVIVQQLLIRNTVTVVATVTAMQACPEALAEPWRSERLQVLHVQPLTRLHSDQLIPAALGGPVDAATSKRLWDMTLGNVMYLRELITQERSAGRLTQQDGVWQWQGHMGIGSCLADLVELQIGAGVHPIHDVLDLVTVAEPLESDCLDALTDRSLIDEAQQRGIITATTDLDGTTFRVAHPLYAEVRRARSGKLRLRRLRGQVARELTRAGHSDPIRLALLWLEADCTTDASASVFLRAAEQAARQLEFELALKFIAAASTAGAGTDALILRAYILSQQNRADEAESILNSLDPTHICRINWISTLQLRVSNLLWPLARPADAWLAATAEPGGDRSTDSAAERAAVQSICLAMAAKPAQVTALLQQVDGSSLTASPAMTALCALTLAHGDLGSPSAAQACAAQGYRLAQAAPETAIQSTSLAEFEVCAQAFAGFIPEAMHAAELTHSRYTADRVRLISLAIIGLAARHSGDLGRAVACLTQACAEFDARGDTSGVNYRFSVACTEALARSGDLAAASAMQRRTHDLRHPTMRFVECDSLIADAWVAATTGHNTQAQLLARRAAAVARQNGQSAREVWCLQTMIQFGSTAIDVGSRLDQLSTLVDGPRARLAARYAHARADKDRKALDSIGAEFVSMGDRLAAADAYAHAHLLHKSSGRRGAALTSWTQARHIMEQCGAVSPALLAAQLPFPLNPREHEIVAMIGQGLSNKAIADALSISVRTVEGNIYRACGKVGVVSRSALADMILPRTLRCLTC